MLKNQSGPACRQAGFAHILGLVLLLAGLLTGVFLVQQKTSIFSKAYQPKAPLRTVSENNFEIGLEAGAQDDASKVNLVKESGAKWVRLNFIGEDWATGSATVAKYNNIINAYGNEGIKIIGLIGAESVEGGYDRNNPEIFSEKFINTTDAIVSQFRDRVKVYELFNEPNDWAGGSSSQISENYFARYLAGIYQRIKIERKMTDISLNSGPLFSFDFNNGAGYLDNIYNEGSTLSGPLNWETIKAQTGSYPLDGIGYHIYVAQGMGDQDQVENKVRSNLEAMKLVIASRDFGKQLWITEFGWGTGEGRVTQEVQSANMEKAFNILKNDSLVRLGMWFTLADFDSNGWGLINGNTKKIAWYTFLRITGRISSPSPSPTPAPFICTACGADVNKDSKINIGDFSYLSGCFGKSASDNMSNGKPCAPADINGDGNINITDFSCLKSQYGKQCTASSSAQLKR